jgi:dGTPase
MQWQQLYSAQRTGSLPKVNVPGETARTSFIRDYDRIIFSSAFRRLQNKTQVFPLPGAVFVHNRLTHSLEVASVGRSLGKAAGDKLAEEHGEGDERFIEFYKYELPNVIAAACLAHDIGNPPFGHSGEEAIRVFFKNLTGSAKERFETELTFNQQRDFLFFEGNANAFRTLTHAFGEPLQGGYRLTYTTLASIVKYPCSSQAGFNKQQLVTRKSGFFDSEISTFQDIAKELGIPLLSDEHAIYARHPFVYLVEAADDICYRVIDFEDAHRLGIISLEKLQELFLAFFDEEEGYNNRETTEINLSRIVDANQKVQYLRAKLINHLVYRVRDIFLSNQQEILNGKLAKPLVDYLPEREKLLMKEIDNFSVSQIYNHRSVIEIEVAGFNVIGALLEHFVEAVLYPKNSKSSKLLKLIPAQFVLDFEGGSLYHQLQAVVDYVAGMTDLYAMDLFQKITGIRLSSAG